MIFNIIIGFLIPWLFIILLYKKNRMLVITIAPVACIISHIINTFGYYFKWWTVYPFDLGALSTLPSDLGYFMFSGTFLIYKINQKKFDSSILIITFSTILTLCEFIIFLLGGVVYYNAWNFFLTWLSYIFASLIGYLYYLLLIKIKILK